MDSPVSAFAVYKSNKASNKAKKQCKKGKKSKINLASRKAPLPLPPNLNCDEVTKDIAKKIKKNVKKLKNKESKLITKKKQHKMTKVKKPNIIKVTNNQTQNNLSESDGEIPILVPTPELKPAAVSSHSSNDSFNFEPITTDSEEQGLQVFKWIIAPYEPEDFFNTIWEKKPLHIARKKLNYYRELITSAGIDKMLRDHHIEFTKNIDITSYVDGKRETHNLVGRAHPQLVWPFYLDGCSVRLLNPQTYIPKLHLLNATMQEFFKSFVGANAYLTPPDSQGFAPHYDDIEAFILQTEGKKHWRVYEPLSDNEVLPRVSSRNYNQDEIGKPILEVTLEAGDMLYFPRGYIHQGVTVEGEHSLHVTISMYQKHSWGDLFEKLIPAALKIAINENVEFRRGLPLDIYDNLGLVHSDSKTPRRKELEKTISSLFNKIVKYLPIDDAVDQMNKEFQHAALPPVLGTEEIAVTAFGDDEVMVNGKIINRVEIGLDTKIRLLRKNILRMVSEDKIRLYYYVENSLEYHGNELPYLEIEDDLAPAVETLILSYPEYVAVENLDIPNDSDKLQIADVLWCRGLLMTETPLETVDD